MTKLDRSLFFSICVQAGLLIASPCMATGMPAEQVKSILNLTKANWVAYRDYNGQQLIYFTHLESWKCGISSVHYGLNGQPLEKVWQLADCDEKNPNQVTKERPYLTFPLGHVKSIKVQLRFTDKSQSEIIEFKAP